MIFWSGGLIVVFIFAGQAAAYPIATHLSGNPNYVDLHGWPLGVDCFASATLCWLLDAWVNNALDRALPVARTGRAREGWLHALTFHPIRWCSAGMVVIGVLLCFYHRTPEQLWRSRQDQASRLEAPRTHHDVPPANP